jgi:hypothetical protein
MLMFGEGGLVDGEGGTALWEKVLTLSIKSTS